MTTYNLFLVEDGPYNGVFYRPYAVNVTAEEMGITDDDFAESIRSLGYNRFGGGAQPIFHVEACPDPNADLEDIGATHAPESYR